MATQLSKGHTFVPGEVVDPDDLNDLVDSAIARVTGGLITEQAAVSAATGDSVLISDVSDAGKLKKALVSTLPSGVTSVSVTIDSGSSVLNFSVATPSTTPVFHIGLDNQIGNKFLASPVDGSNGTPAFRVISPVDLPSSTVSIAALTIDWNLGSMFMKQLVNNSTFIFTNASAGQTIRVLLYQDATGGRTVAWPATPGVRWPNGTNPVQSPHGIDIYTFHYIGGVYYGTFDQNFAF